MTSPQSPPSPDLDLGQWTQGKRDRLQQLLAEKAARRVEALRIWEPLPDQERFHASRASQRVLRGGWRGGKSVCAAVEVARAATGQDPHAKYPEGPMTVWIMAYEEGNIGRTIYRLLFRPGAFRMIRDRKTDLWRAFRPWDPEDAGRKKESKPAPALIPARFIADWAWDNKGLRIFSLCRLKNGSEIFAFKSGGNPPTGDPADLVWIDEDLKYPEHHKELESRLSDRKGRLIWSAKPRSEHEALVSLCDRAEEQQARERPDVEQFRLAFSENPHIDADEKRKRIEGWSDQERQSFDYGEFGEVSLVYPSWNPSIHGVPLLCDAWDQPLRDQPTPLDRALVHLEIPRDWTRYMVVDPGHTVCAVLFAAVPPPHLADCVVLYDELYLPNCDPDVFGREVAAKASGCSFYAFLIDDRGSRVRLGTKMTVRQLYSTELAKRRIESESTGPGFLPGSDDVQAGLSAVRLWLAPREEDGTPRLRYLRTRCRALRQEFGKYRKRCIAGTLQDKPIEKHNHQMDNLRYLAMYNPSYHPPLHTSGGSAAYMAYCEMLRERERNRPQGALHLGPGKGDTPR